MTSAFSTNDVDPRDRISYWVDVASKMFFNHGFNAPAREFGGTLKSGTLDMLRFVECGCGPCEVTRTRRDINQDGIDDYLLCIRLKGRSEFVQGDQRIMIEPGMMVLQDAVQPMRVRYLDQSASLFVSMPRSVIETRLGRMPPVRATTSCRPVPGIAAEFLRLLTTRMKTIDAAARMPLAEQAADLIAMAFSAGEDVPAPTSVRAGALARLKAAIDARLSDAGLKPAQVAAAAGISVRYANALLAEEGTSIERYMMHRRLHCCRQSLEDPMQARRTVSEIAFSWGFSDLSHFSRRFRAEFAVTPSECRRRALTIVEPLPPTARYLG